MKLLIEQSDVSYLIEENDTAGKNYYLSGIFMQAEVKNRNGRVYPQDIMEKEIQRYQTVIKDRKSTGELGHPANPSINLDRISHLITELKMDGKNVIGKAKILDTPMGKIAKALIDDDIQLGVSSRGLGSLKESKGIKIVQPDFQLATVDIVSDPSSPDAFPENLIENTDWFFDGIEWRKREAIEEIIQEHKQLSRTDREEQFLKMFNKLLKTI